MTFLDVFGPGNLKQAETCVLQKDTMISLLDHSDAEYLICYDIPEARWNIDIATDTQGTILSLRYSHDGNFLSMRTVMVSSLDALVGACLCASFTCQQFDYIVHHHGKNVFPISRFNERRECAEIRKAS